MRCNILLLMTVLLCGIMMNCSNNHELKNDEVVIFFGDSITELGVKSNGYVKLTDKEIQKAYPDKNIKVIGAGISGHKVPDLQARLQRDVLSKNPTMVVIYIGINDVWHWDWNKGTAKEDFENGLNDLITKIKKAGSKVILCTPTVIGEKLNLTNRLDKELEKYAAISRKVAAVNDIPLLDLRVKFMEYLQTNNPENLEKGILTYDGVHLTDEGNRYLADIMLEALNVKSVK